MNLQARGKLLYGFHTRVHLYVFANDTFTVVSNLHNETTNVSKEVQQAQFYVEFVLESRNFLLFLKSTYNV